ncbi:MAG: ATP-binding cassette domain-containing protein [Bacilli bacterium]|jgi:ABC-2 type transport system ATP-binding protein|nr:ATP-binding cassette domain-containing protein [Bacilli bacterium]MCX4253869.1 ATP-binding cassette domain-containing protein [Bacilli bacterium]
MLKLENVTKYYGTNLAVDNLSFTINNGEIFGLLGVNGAGKTTTFRMIMGLLEPTKGKITIDDKIVDYSLCENIGFLTEERSLLTKLTVKEQVIYYGTLKGMTESAILKKLDYWLERFGVLDYKERKIKELSKGNQQKIQFITAIIHEPSLLVLDEPFTGLDPINVELFMAVIREFKEKGKMIIFSSHRMEHVELFCEKLVILKKGKTVLSGSLKSIKKNYQKKTIKINGDIDIKSLEKIKGVQSVSKENLDIIVKIESDEYIKDVFKIVKNSDNITKFLVEDASLNEIFLDTVGEVYEK